MGVGPPRFLRRPGLESLLLATRRAALLRMPPRGRRRAVVGAAFRPADRPWRDRHQRLNRSVTGTPDRPRAASEAVPLPPTSPHQFPPPPILKPLGRGGALDGQTPPDGGTNETPLLAIRPTGHSKKDPRTQCMNDAQPPWQGASATRGCRPSHEHAPARVQRENATRHAVSLRRRKNRRILEICANQSHLVLVELKTVGGCYLGPCNEPAADHRLQTPLDEPAGVMDKTGVKTQVDGERGVEASDRAR